MALTVEAEIDVHGNIRLLEPLAVTEPRRVLVTLLDETVLPINGTAI